MTDSIAIRIYLVDDQNILRAAFRSLLDSDEGIEVVGDSGDARTAIERIEELRPDVVLLDISMPGLSGLDAIAPMRKAWKRVRILMLTHHEGESFVEQAMRSGADGYLSKDSEPEELRLAITSIFAGETYVSPKVTNALAGESRTDAPASSMLDRLTPREREVFQLLALGKANKEVAEVLDLSLGTVKKHRENLQRKLECRSGAEIARLAIREGLLGP